MNKKLIFAIGIILAIVSYSRFKVYNSVDKIVPHHITQMFQQWLVRHDKSYSRPEELLHRLRIFYENYKYVTERNLKNDGVVLGLTMFADLHSEEFVAQYKIKNKSKKNDFKAKKSQINAKKAKIVDQTNLNQQPGPSDDVVDWETADGGNYLPPVGSQIPACSGSVGAWAFQYALTANHRITNKIKTTPIPTVSAQWMLDCYTYLGESYQCGRVFFKEKLDIVNLLLVGEYPQEETGKPGPCKATLVKLNQAVINRPELENYNTYNTSDKYLEEGIKKGVIIGRIQVIAKIV